MGFRASSELRPKLHYLEQRDDDDCVREFGERGEREKASRVLDIHSYVGMASNAGKYVLSLSLSISLWKSDSQDYCA